MPQKTFTVEHPDAHQATQEAVDAALVENQVGEGWELVRSVNESGVSTKYTVKWGEDDVEQAVVVEPEKSKAKRS
jgi:LmbE family N-acetylglucosaminyl deacetylase